MNTTKHHFWVQSDFDSIRRQPAANPFIIHRYIRWKWSLYDIQFLTEKCTLLVAPMQICRLEKLVSTWPNSRNLTINSIYSWFSLYYHTLTANRPQCLEFPRRVQCQVRNTLRGGVFVRLMIIWSDLSNLWTNISRVERIMVMKYLIKFKFTVIRHKTSVFFVVLLFYQNFARAKFAPCRLMCEYH